MVIVGVLYLLFEDFVLSDFGSSLQTVSPTAGHTVRRALMGAQVGRIGAVVCGAIANGSRYRLA